MKTLFLLLFPALSFCQTFTDEDYKNLANYAKQLEAEVHIQDSIITGKDAHIFALEQRLSNRDSVIDSQAVNINLWKQNAALYQANEQTITYAYNSCQSQYKGLDKAFRKRKTAGIILNIGLSAGSFGLGFLTGKLIQ